MGVSSCSRTSARNETWSSGLAACPGSLCLLTHQSLACWVQKPSTAHLPHHAPSPSETSPSGESPSGPWPPLHWMTPLALQAVSTVRPGLWPDWPCSLLAPGPGLPGPPVNTPCGPDHSLLPRACSRPLSHTSASPALVISTGHPLNSHSTHTPCSSHWLIPLALHNADHVCPLLRAVQTPTPSLLPSTSHLTPALSEAAPEVQLPSSLHLRARATRGRCLCPDALPASIRQPRRGLPSPPHLPSLSY